MNILLTEDQYKKILGESVSNDVKEKMAKSESLTKQIVRDSKQKFKLDSSFLLTWGAVLGGFMNPVVQFLNGKYPELTSTDISLISLGVIMTYFFSNIDKLRPVLDLIRKNGLVNEFDEALQKAGALKDAFVEFMRSLGVLISSVGNMLAYAFLIPLLPTLLTMSQSGITEAKLQFLVKSIMGYVGLITSSTALQKIIEKMVNRFKD
jgi:predicted PurR-regulated permease PerM